MDIAKIDKNFAVQTKIKREGLEFHCVDKAPFRVFGVKWENGYYRRLPERVAAATNEGVLCLHANTTGGRLRFVTDSPYIAIRAQMDGYAVSSHFAFTGKSGFDLFIDGKYRQTFVPPVDAMEDGYESVVDIKWGKGKHEVLIHFPLYANVKQLLIGLREGCVLEEAPAYTVQKPVVYYGSSITQGACATRAGNSYQNMLSYRLDCDHINLGFSGSAKGEPVMAEYIAGLSMSAFVLDYDHNAPTVEHLQKTHEPFFLCVRKAHPELPVLFLTRPKFYLNEEDEQRLAVVRTTYENALARGDKNVYFIPGPALVEGVRDVCLVDNCHPNDAGFFSMANVIEPVLRRMIR